VDSITTASIASAVASAPPLSVGSSSASALAYPYYAYPYAAYPIYADPVYPDPVYAPAPVYQPQTQLSVAPSSQTQVCYTGGCYYLRGDGVTVAYSWVWVPAAPAAPPAPSAPPSR